MRILSSFFVVVSLFVLGFFIESQIVSASCDATYDGKAAQFLKNCATSTNTISPSAGWDGVTSIKELVKNISKKVIEYGALFAIGAIVFSGVQYTTSYGDDEKVKKAKITGLYALLGLLLLLLAFPLVDMMVNFVYTLGS